MRYQLRHSPEIYSVQATSGCSISGSPPVARTTTSTGMPAFGRHAWPDRYPSANDLLTAPVGDPDILEDLGELLAPKTAYNPPYSSTCAVAGSHRQLIRRSATVSTALRIVARLFPRATREVAPQVSRVLGGYRGRPQAGP